MKKLLLIVLAVIGIVGTSGAWGSHWDVVDNFGNRGNFNFMTADMCYQFVRNSGGYWRGCVVVND